VQHVIVNTAQVTSPVDDGWTTNGGGFHFNHKFGFGRLDCARMVEVGKNWRNVPKQKKCLGPSGTLGTSPVSMIPIGGTLAVTIDTGACEGSDEEIKKLEHVTLTISFQHRRRGDVSIDLFSPSGTRNEMLSTRRYDDSDKGLHDWTFMSVHNWGENPKGVWTLNITDNILALTSHGINLNGYTQHDTSTQEPDVEDLEQEVIDDEKRLKELELKKKAKQKDGDTAGTSTSALDVPVPNNNNNKNNKKRSKIKTYDVKHDELDEDRTLIERDDETLSMLRTTNPSKNINNNIVAKKTVINENFDDDKALQAMANGLMMSDEDLFLNSENKKSETTSSDENQIYGYDRNFKHITKQQKNSKRNDLLLAEDPRVQVQEETGSQRVQVSNGYQEPYNMDGVGTEGRSESGQVLEWSLTFWGTGIDDDEV